MTVVVSVLAAGLVGSTALVGLLVALFQLGWVWPSLFMPWVLEGRPRKLTWYRASAFVRVGAWAAIGFVLLSDLPHDRPNLTFWVVCALVFLLASAGGVSAIPFMDLVAQNVPIHRRGIFWSLRQGTGAILSVGGAVLVRTLLDPASGLAFPRGHAYLFLVAAAIHGCALLSFSFVHEEPRPARPRRMTPWMHTARGGRLLTRDPAFRAWAVARLAVSLGQMGLPFLALYARNRFGMTDADTAGMLLLCAIGGVVLPFAWGAISDHLGSRVGARVASVLVIAFALCVLLAAAAPAGRPELARLALSAAFVSGYASVSCGFISLQNHLLELAPANRRDVYLGFSNILAIPLCFISLLAGALAEWTGILSLFAIGAAMGGVALALSWRWLAEPRLAAE